MTRLKLSHCHAARGWGRFTHFEHPPLIIRALKCQINTRASELNEEEGALIMQFAKKTHTLPPPTIGHMDELLDEALNETFPASDPVAINIERASDQPAVTLRRMRSAGFAEQRPE